MGLVLESDVNSSGTPMKFVALLLIATPVVAAELPDISSVAPDLIVPPLSDGSPVAGKRVRWGRSVLYLPSNWNKDVKWPVLVELAGNGRYANKFGDTSIGLPEASNLGFGLSGGRNFIWLCVPYLNTKGDQIAITWWGDPPVYDPQPTLKNLREAVHGTCLDFSGNPAKVVLAGFSRGAIACNFLGLQDDATAGLWCAFLAYSHYDGVRKWPYPGSDRESALTRLQRLGTRPQFICGEGTNAQETEAYLRPLLPSADLTFVSTGFRNHNDAWVLRPSPSRDAARSWLRRVTESSREREESGKPSPSGASQK